MKRKNSKNTVPELVEDDDLNVPEFDFDNAVPNKFAGRYGEGAAYQIIGLDGVTRTYVQLDADLVEKFASPKSVNNALRMAMKNETKKQMKADQTKTQP